MKILYILMLFDNQSINLKGNYIEFNSLRACEASAKSIEEYRLAKAVKWSKLAKLSIKKGDCIKIYRGGV